jgi:hypothetical protein
LPQLIRFMTEKIGSRFFSATCKVHDFVDATMASLAGDGGPNVANFLQGISWCLGVGLVGHGYKYAF